jgi:hypothetical protein
MEDGSGVRRVFSVGRAVLWLVLVLMTLAVGYALTISLANWRTIGV